MAKRLTTLGTRGKGAALQQHPDQVIALRNATRSKFVGDPLREQLKSQIMKLKSATSAKNDPREG